MPAAPKSPQSPEQTAAMANAVSSFFDNLGTTKGAVDVVTGMIKGNSTDILGAPIDIINTLLSPITKAAGLHTDNPALGSKHIRELFGLPGEDTSPQETLGTLLSPEGAAKAMIVGATRLSKVAKNIDINKATELITKHPEVNMASVHNMTGVYKDKDGLKAAISDKEAKLIGLPGEGSKQLNEVLYHPKLFSTYPELANITVKGKISGAKEGSYTSLGKDDGIMTVSKIGFPFVSSMTLRNGTNQIRDDFLNTILHETQHAIQGFEGFSKGTNPQKFLNFNPAKVQEKLNAARKSGDPDKIAAAERFKIIANKKSTAAYEKYMDNAGEQEARFTELMKDKNEVDINKAVNELLKTKQSPQDYR